MSDNLTQPLVVKTPEPGHEPKDVLALRAFIFLLKEEEDYWTPDQNNTKLMISKLRKIFYDQWGWNSELIRGAKDIESRYVVKILQTQTPYSKPAKRYKNRSYQPVFREVTYSATDKVFGNTKVGEVPYIYRSDHKEVVLPDGHYCDISHVLAGLDAYNYKEPVSPLPYFLFFLKNLLPHVDSNEDIVTWLGDIASSSGDFVFDFLRNGNKPVSIGQEQAYINVDAPGSQMLGDIDPYVIGKHYDIGSINGMRCTDILEDYYLNEHSPGKKRFSTFCESVGLTGWDGNNFQNEQEWMDYYIKQLRDNITFQVYSLSVEFFSTLVLVLKIWFNGYKDVLKKKLLLEIWLKALKENIKMEPL
jgi:hypothetical protein